MCKVFSEEFGGVWNKKGYIIRNLEIIGDKRCYINIYDVRSSLICVMRNV